MKKILLFIFSILGKIQVPIRPKKYQPLKIPYHIVKVTKQKKKPSIKQLEWMLRMKMSMQLLKPMFEFLPVTFRNAPGKMIPRNKALSYNIRNAIKGEYPNLKIDHEAVKVSRGNLFNSTSADTYASEGKIHFNWKNLQINNAKDDDVAVLVAYCPARQKCIYTTTGPRRSEERGVLDVQQFKSNIVHAYLSFISASGNLVADSRYTGRFTIN
jgi:hypothetical protein